MAISFTCECGKEFAAREELAGKTGICPACNRKFVVPGGALPPPPVVAPVEVALPPLSVQGATPNPDEPGTTAEQEKPRAFWKDPIVAVGAAVPTAILVVFFTYLYLQHSAKAFRDRVHLLKAQADQLDRSSQYRSAFVKYEEVLTLSRAWRGGDRELRDDFVGARKSRDRLYAAVKRDLDREEKARRAKQEAERLAAQPKPVVIAVEPRLVPDYTDWRIESSFTWVDGFATCVAFAPDGRTIAVGGGTWKENGVGVPEIETGMLRLWDIETKEAKLSVAEPSNQINSVSFYPDGSALAVGDREKVVVINPESGALKFRLPNLGYETAPAINRKYKILALTGPSFWDSASGASKPVPSAFYGHGTGGRGAFSNNDLLYYLDSVVYTVSPWGKYCDLPADSWLVTFSHDSKLLTTGDSVWNLSDCTMVWKRASEYTTGIAFTPDDKFLLTAYQDGKLRITEVATGKLAGIFRPHDHVGGISLSPDGKLLVTVSYNSPGEPVRVWRVALKPAS